MVQDYKAKIFISHFYTTSEISKTIVVLIPNALCVKIVKIAKTIKATKIDLFLFQAL